MNKIKTVIVPLATVLLLAALCGCGSPAPAASNTVTPRSVAAATQTLAPTTEPPTPSPTVAPMVGSGTLGEYDVAIKDFALTQDYDGKDAIVITYDWTNNGDDATSAASALSAEVYQNGIECDTAIIMDESKCDSSNYMKKIKPGVTLTVQEAFVLQDITNPVDVEISQLVSFDDTAVTQTFDITK